MEKPISQAILKGYLEKLQEALDLDVAIAGAGPSGLMAALRLAEAGRKVAIFERALRPGGGIWGGAMLMNEIVVQAELSGLLEELGIRYREAEGSLLRIDAVEAAAALTYRAVHAGARVFNAITVEDLIVRRDRVCGVVLNWTTVLGSGLPVDPLAVSAKFVVDATGHGAELTSRLSSKAGVELATPHGRVIGEKPLWSEAGEEATVSGTSEVYPGLIVCGMAAIGVHGAHRMGPIFGGMFRSGEKAASLILERLG